MAGAFPPDKLIDLYRIALDEYRFEVRLGWDRTTYFLILNSAILTVSTGLLKLDGPPAIYGFVAVLSLFGSATSAVGSMSITKAHEYYRWTVVKKTIIENCLGLTEPIDGMHPILNFTVRTTAGQKDHMQILMDPESWVRRKRRRTSITLWLRWILRGMAAVDLCGFVAAILMMFYGLSPSPHPLTLMAVVFDESLNHYENGAATRPPSCR